MKKNMMLLSSANHSRSPTYQTLQLITRGAVYKKTCADLKKHTPVCETHAEDLEGTFSGLVKKKKCVIGRLIYLGRDGVIEQGEQKRREIN